MFLKPDDYSLMIYFLVRLATDGDYSRSSRVYFFFFFFQNTKAEQPRFQILYYASNILPFSVLRSSVMSVMGLEMGHSPVSSGAQWFIKSSSFH